MEYLVFPKEVIIEVSCEQLLSDTIIDIKYFTLTGKRRLLMPEGFQIHFIALSSYLTDHFLAKNIVELLSLL